MIKTEQAILERLKGSLELYIDRLYKDNVYPLKCYILGFGWCFIENKEQHLGRIHELCEILGIQNEDLYNYKLKYKNLSGDIEALMKNKGGLQNGNISLE